MLNKNKARLRRARKTRARIAEKKQIRLAVHRTNSHIYAQIISENGDAVLASASSVEPGIRKDLSNGGNVEAAKVVGQKIAEKAVEKGIKAVVFDRSGNRYHGRVKALADAAREHGLQF